MRHSKSLSLSIIPLLAAIAASSPISGDAVAAAHKRLDPRDVSPSLSDVTADADADAHLSREPHSDGSHSSDSETPSHSLVPVPHKMKHSHGVPILHTDLSPEERLFWENYSTETFFTTPSDHRGALYVHIASYVGSYIFLFPIVLVLWNIKHSWYLPALTAHTVLVAVSSVTYWVFSASIKDLYPHSAFATMTVLLFVGSIVHWVVALLAVAYRSFDLEHDFAYAELDSEEESSSLASPNSTLRGSNSRFHSFDSDHAPLEDSAMKTSIDSMLHEKPSRFSQFFLKFPFLKKATHAFGKTALSLTGVINWVSFAYFLVYFPTGIATYLLYGEDEFKFNLLAHFIKGGVFFVLGLVTLARYCGAFRGKGWAWNHRFVTSSKANSGLLKWQSKGLITMEFIESSLILFYGSTNIFLEHLAAAGGAWTAKDLQHISIAFIYIGCGLCGVLLEKKLADWRYNRAIDNLSSVKDSKDVATVQKATPGFSPNPFPVITIYWTGILMSSHEQASELSSTIHKQWGNLFVFGCVFRVLSYIWFTMSPATYKHLTKPVYPMTELFVAFGLLCGGAVFMESTDSVIHSLEYYGYTPMFTLNLFLGFVALVMAWEMAVFSIKDALLARKIAARY